MIARNKFTGEVIKDLDPSDDDNQYYHLDKREWSFEEEFDPGPLCIITTARTHDIGRFPEKRTIQTFSDLIGYKLNHFGQLYKPEEF